MLLRESYVYANSSASDGLDGSGREYANLSINSQNSFSERDAKQATSLRYYRNTVFPVFPTMALCPGADHQFLISVPCLLQTRLHEFTIFLSTVLTITDL